MIIEKKLKNFIFFKEVKLKSPDYKDVPQEEAVADFLSRIQQYEKRYEPIDDKTMKKIFHLLKYLIVVNVFLSIKLEVNISFFKHLIQILFIFFSGHIQSRVVYFLMNIHVSPRTIYLTRVNKIKNFNRIFFI